MSYKDENVAPDKMQRSRDNGYINVPASQSVESTVQQQEQVGGNLSHQKNDGVTAGNDDRSLEDQLRGGNSSRPQTMVSQYGTIIVHRKSSRVM